MEYLPQRSLAEVAQAFAVAVRDWRTRESTRAMWRRTFSIAVILALGAIGPIFITLSIFPDRPTAVGGSGEQRCEYDAATVPPVDRLNPMPVPQPKMAGQATTFELPVLNSGTCDWSADVTLYREGGNLPDTPPFISATTTASKGLFTAQIPFTAPATIGVYNVTWRMRTPDNRSFGATLAFSIVTHVEGTAPVIPADPPITFGKLIAFAAFLAPGLLGFGLALYRSGRFVKEFYGLKSDGLGRAHALRLLFNRGKGVSAAAKAGQLEVSADNEAIDKIGGPGALTVHSGTAAVIERGGGYSRIEGPGKIRLGPFEWVRAVIDVRKLSRTKTESARTKDGIEVKSETTMSFKLIGQMDGEQIPPPQPRPSPLALFLAWLGLRVKAPKPPAGPPASPETMRRIVYDLPAGTEWDKTLSSGLGDLIPQKMLDELWAPDDPNYNPRREIVEKLLKEGQEKQRKNGIELIDMSIGPLQAPDEVIKQRREYWSADWEKLSRVTQAEGYAEALRQKQTARAEAQAEMIQTIMQGFRMIAFSGAAQPSQQVAVKLIEIVARTMKATLEEAADEAGGSADKALLILERLLGIVKP